jgi:hypothetical protein
MKPYAILVIRLRASSNYGRGLIRRCAADQNNAGFEPWVPDICRHSFGFYWLALHKNRAELTELMGNSVQVIKAHYRAPVLEAEAVAVAYFALRP